LTRSPEGFPLGFVNYENASNAKGERYVWLDLRALRDPDESYSDVNIRVAREVTAGNLSTRSKPPRLLPRMLPSICFAG
jgi:hypothetical protein